MFSTAVFGKRGRDCLAAKHRSVGSWHSADVCIGVCGVWDRVGGGEDAVNIKVVLDNGQ